MQEAEAGAVEAVGAAAAAGIRHKHGSIGVENMSCWADWAEKKDKPCSIPFHSIPFQQDMFHSIGVQHTD